MRHRDTPTITADAVQEWARQIRRHIQEIQAWMDQPQGEAPRTFRGTVDIIMAQDAIDAIVDTVDDMDMYAREAQTRWH